MEVRQRTRKGIGRYAILRVTGAILGTACADPALADAVKAKISKPAPPYRAVNNGSSYTQVQGALLPAKFTVEADAEIAGKVTAISYKASSKWTGAVGFSPPAKLTATDDVSDASLALIEQYGPGGTCR